MADANVFSNPSLSPDNVQTGEKVAASLPFGAVQSNVTATEEYNKHFFKTNLGVIDIQPSTKSSAIQWFHITLDSLKIKRMIDYAWYRPTEIKIQGKRDDAVVARNGSIVVFLTYEPYQTFSPNMTIDDAQRFPSAKILTFNDPIEFKFSWQQLINVFRDGWRPLQATGTVPIPYTHIASIGVVAKTNPNTVPYTLPIEITGTIESKGYLAPTTSSRGILTKTPALIPYDAKFSVNFNADLNQYYLLAAFDEGTNVNASGVFVPQKTMETSFTVTDASEEPDEDGFYYTAETHHVLPGKIRVVIIAGKHFVYFPTTIAGTSNFPEPILISAESIFELNVAGFYVFEEQIPDVMYEGVSVRTLPDYTGSHKLKELVKTDGFILKSMQANKAMSTADPFRRNQGVDEPDQ